MNSNSFLDQEEDLLGDFPVAEKQSQDAAPGAVTPTSLLSRFPGLVPLRNDLSLYRGSVKLGTSDVELELRCTSQGIKLETEDAKLSSLYKKLEAESPEFFAKIHSIRDPNRFLHELLSAADTFREVNEPDRGAIRKVDALTYRVILEKLQRIGREYLRSVDSDLVTFQVCDLQMTYSLSEEMVRTATVPQQVLKQMCSKKCDILDAFNSFKSKAEKLRVFYQSLESLDWSHWIIDPSDLKQAYRRVALEKSSILQITFLDPLQAGQPPILELFGCRSSFQEFTDLLKDRSWTRKWNPKLDVLGNLRAAFGETLRFLSKEECAEGSVACAICYAYLLGDQTPKVFCENVQCHRPYHEECFKIWALEQEAEHGLRRTVLTAPCVYCEKPILFRVTQ